MKMPAALQSKPVMFLGAAGALGGAYLFFRKPAMTLEQRAANMARLADYLHKVIAKMGTPADRAGWSEEAAKLAEAFELKQTAAGIRNGSGLPKTENWPGTVQSVAEYMTAYIKLRTPPKPTAANPSAAPARVFNDEVPIPPFEDPRTVRAQAVAAEKAGNTLVARVLHAKADGLNNTIKAAKLKNTAVDTFKAVASVFKR